MRYTVTIKPEEGPTLIAAMEVNGAGATIQTISAHAPEGGTIGAMPIVDFAKLTEALTSSVQPSGVATTPPAKSSPSKTPAVASRATGRKAAKTEASKSKPKRSMPADDDLLSVISQVGVGNMVGIADHYGVTPQGAARWVRALRERGVLPPRDGAQPTGAQPQP